ncbi:MAG: hypothetical protein L6247_08785 [Desulfobacteraceae bacterium]|nr:hypothetical protein [Pseudomonadota bacterium]MBU4463502.1 hypothetical protein [Pseudomonadota bacterium]MCG2755640.1 hypothetical protein [Desulfobacteraceae bacterium]
MIVNKVEVSAKGENYSGIVLLTLVQKDDGWTYDVDNMTGGNFALTWRAETPEKASSKLRDIYKDEIWDFKIVE